MALSPQAEIPGTATHVPLPASPVTSPTRGQDISTPMIGAIPLAALQAVMAELPETNEIAIADDWVGLGTDAPLEAHYRLIRQGNDFSGPARFVADGSGYVPRAASVAISLASAAAQPFFRLLAQTPLREGHYQPVITHTDDYPQMKISLHPPAGQITFWTNSNTKGNAPWGMSYLGTQYVAENDVPARALALLVLALGMKLWQDKLAVASNKTRAGRCVRPASVFVLGHALPRRSPLAFVGRRDASWSG